MTNTRDVVQQYHEGKRWSLSYHEKDLTPEEERVLQKNKLDYRDRKSFIFSKQVYLYAERFVNLKFICFYDEEGCETRFECENDTIFKWSHLGTKAREFITGDIPTGADPVLYLLFNEMSSYKINFETFCPHLYDGRFELDPIVEHVYFHGEDLPFYRYYTPINPYREPSDISRVTSCEYAYYQPILNILALTGDLSFCSHEWSKGAINEAIRMVKQELTVIELDKEFYCNRSLGLEQGKTLSFSLRKLEEMFTKKK